MPGTVCYQLYQMNGAIYVITGSTSGIPVLLSIHDILTGFRPEVVN